MRHRLAWVAVTAAAATALIAGGGAAQARTTCSSGRTLFRSGAARIFAIPVRSGRERYDHFFFCGAALRRPVFLDADEEDAHHRFSGFRVFGNRIAYRVLLETDPQDDILAGWVNVVTGAKRSSWESLADEPAGLAVGPDGGMALLFAGSDPATPDEVAYAAPRGTKTLGRPVRVATGTPGDRIVPASLLVAGGQITWRTASGATGSAALG